MQVHIFDPQLNASDGHYLEYDSAVATELRRRGIHTSLLGSTRRTGALSAPGDTRPVFTAEIFDQISHDRLVWALEDFDQIGSQFHKNLASLDTGQFSVTDIAFFPNLTQNQLGGIRAWICGLPPERRPILILKFSYLTYAMGYVQRRPNKELIPLMFRFGIRSLLAAHPRTVICTDSEEIAGELKVISDSVVPILPLPLTIDEELAPHDRRALCVSYLGYPSSLKGFHLLPQIIAQFGKGPNSPHFLIQSYSDREGCSQIENALEGLPNVTLIRGFVSRPTYNELLRRADIVLMPYLREFYGWATSGIFAEALSAGKVVVVPEQTWMSRQLASYRAGGTTFAVQDANHITAALRRALSNFGSLSQSASSARAAWKAHHCPASFVDRFLALASELAGRLES